MGSLRTSKFLNFMHSSFFVRIGSFRCISYCPLEGGSGENSKNVQTLMQFSYFCYQLPMVKNNLFKWKNYCSLIRSAKLYLCNISPRKNSKRNQLGYEKGGQLLILQTWILFKVNNDDTNNYTGTSVNEGCSRQTWFSRISHCS